MTVCIAALSAKGACIICLADKALSYGEDVSWDSDSAKIIPLGQSEAVALTAGSDRYITRLLGKIKDFDGYAGLLANVVSFLEQKYQECVREMQDIEILLPRMLTRDQYVTAISGADTEYMREIDRDIRQFHFDCALIVCGFAQKMLPYILLLLPPGVVTDCTNNGFCATGSGAEKAMSRLLFVDHKRDHGVVHVLYDCFDAKANAEMNSFVGYDWDAYVLFDGRVKAVPPKAKPLLDRVWAARNRSPFKKKRDPDDLPGPPRNWEMQLREIIAETLGSAFDATGQLKQYPAQQTD
jgi:hypothetical protein